MGNQGNIDRQSFETLADKMMYKRAKENLDILAKFDMSNLWQDKKL